MLSNFYKWYTALDGTVYITSVVNRLQVCIKIGHSGFFQTHSNRSIAEAELQRSFCRRFCPEVCECSGSEKHTRHWVWAHCQSVQHFFVTSEHVVLSGGVRVARVPSLRLFFCAALIGDFESVFLRTCWNLRRIHLCIWNQFHVTTRKMTVAGVVHYEEPNP